MDVSFLRFALEYRKKGAREELEKTNKTLENVAQNWGFTDASHLNRYLKKKQ